jgi:signal transduction histidine kinase
MDSVTATAPPQAPPRQGGLLGWIGVLALLAGGVLLFGLVAASLWLNAANRAGLERAAHTRAVLSALSDVANSVQAAETAQRGFLLTGKDSYLAPYEDARHRLPEAMRRAREEGGPALAPQIDPLEAVVTLKMAELGRTIELERAGQHDAALALVRTDVGQQAMDRIRALYQGIRGVQLAAFLSELAAVSTRGRATLVVDSAGVLGVLVMGGVVAAGLRQGLARLRSAQAELAQANTELAGLNADLEQRVAERTAELTESNDEIQRFAYIVSHDLRAPLVNIMGFTTELESATVLLGRTLDKLGETQPIPAEARAAAADELPEAIRFIKASTTKMDRLIAAILKLSRDGRRTPALERIDTTELVAGIADSMRHQVQSAEATVEVAELPAIDGDRLMLEQIFGNLLDNALKYRAPSRKLRVRVEGALRGRLASFTVADNGRGIAARDRDRVFELFRRAGDQTVSGEGIGLAHVRAMVRRLGGRIDLESQLDAGTTFRIWLPAPQPRRH